MFSRGLVFVVVMLLSPLAAAGELGLILGSYHITYNNGLTHNDRPFKEDYNEINPGLSYRTNNDIIFGAFVNSYTGTTVFVGKRFERNRFGVDLGVSHYGNYKFRGYAEIAPIVQVSYDIQNWRIGFAPMISKENYGVFTLQYIIQTD